VAQKAPAAALDDVKAAAHASFNGLSHAKARGSKAPSIRKDRILKTVDIDREE